MHQSISFNPITDRLHRIGIWTTMFSTSNWRFREVKKLARELTGVAPGFETRSLIPWHIPSRLTCFPSSDPGHMPHCWSFHPKTDVSNPLQQQMTF